jgi:hypothetical protein
MKPKPDPSPPINSSNFEKMKFQPWWLDLMVSFLPATEETRVMGCEIESRQGMGW